MATAKILAPGSIDASKVITPVSVPNPTGAMQARVAIDVEFVVQGTTFTRKMVFIQDGSFEIQIGQPFSMTLFKQAVQAEAARLDALMTAKAALLAAVGQDILTLP